MHFNIRSLPNKFRDIQMYRHGIMLCETFLKLDNTFINRVKCVKFLGLLIDENLNWHEHIDSCR